MKPGQTQMSFGFGSNFTLLGKRLLIAYGIIYIVELICEHWISVPLVSALTLFPPGDPKFHGWQFVTHPFIHNPYSPIGFLLNCLVFYFFSAPLEYVFGRKRFLILFYFSALGGALCGILFSLVSGFGAPFLGMLPSLLSLVVVFGFLNPEATILLMFVLPIKAKYLSYGTILIALMTFLAKVNPHGPHHLGGILFGYVYFKGGGALFNYRPMYLKYMEWSLKRKRSKFKVIDGNKKDDDKPTIH